MTKCQHEKDYIIYADIPENDILVCKKCKDTIIRVEICDHCTETVCIHCCGYELT